MAKFDRKMQLLAVYCDGKVVSGSEVLSGGRGTSDRQVESRGYFLFLAAGNNTMITSDSFGMQFIP